MGNDPCRRHGARRAARACTLVTALLATSVASAEAGATPRLTVPGGSGAAFTVPLTSIAVAGASASSTSTTAALGAKKAHKPRAAPPQVLNPGTPALLRQVASDERQLADLDAYGDALAYLQRAQVADANASRQFAVDMAAWQAAKAQRELALVAQRAAAQQVVLYEQALYELGIAEYTGQTMVNSSNLSVAQHQLVVAQWGEVCATDARGGLDESQRLLAADTERVQQTTALVAFTWQRVQAAKQVLVAAQAQLARSRHAVLVARHWALTPGLAPAEPTAELVVLEGPLPPSPSLRVPVGPAHKRFIAAPDEGLTAVPKEAAKETTAAKARAPGATILDQARLFKLGPTILGPALLTTAQVQTWWASTGAVANATVPIGKLIYDYMREGGLTGVRADIAFAQSVVETGYFSFPRFGQDPASYNNFAGIGACDSCKHGFRYASAIMGVAAQQRLLEEYALPYQYPTIFAQFGVAGTSQTWMALSGVWATNINYGYAILSVYQRMLEFVIDGDFARFSLGSPSTVTRPEKSVLAPSHSPRT
ncbi:MAG TPA: glucosaminidase domain-containing protein [Acidimicrobiales bacterium]|nr:glucosaminidase domain-containing protein [Acidimicrobiales bacterium]